jgi:energy-coupling factor transport system ATP-binding protein
MSQLIRAEGLTHRYSDSDAESPALDGIDLEIPAGQWVAIAGPNGSGKSTLAKHFNALLIPTRGRVLVDGLDTADPSLVWEVRRRVGMVFQNPDNQIVATVVEEDVAFGPENLGVPQAELRRRVDESLARVGMTQHARREPHQLSGGQKQRVAIAGALAMHPACLVLDEATSMLDPVGRADVLSLMQRLNRQLGLTVVHITHHMEEALIADRVLVMGRGRVIKDEPPERLFLDQAAIEAAGLELPPVIRLAGRLRDHGLPIPSGLLSVQDLVGAIVRTADDGH